jgi:hypothetical protein
MLVKIFETFEKKPNIAEHDCIIGLYGLSNSKNRDATRKLFVRFSQRLIESLSFDDNLEENNSIYSPSVLAVIRVRKLLVDIQCLISRGSGQDKKELKILAKNAIRICVDYELFDELIILQKIYYEEFAYQDFSSYLEGKTLLLDLSNLNQKSSLILKSKVHVFELIYDHQFKSRQQIDQKLVLSKAIVELEDDLKFNEISLIRYNLYLLKTQLAHYNYDFKLAVVILTELANFLINSKAVFAKFRLLNCYMNLSYTQLFLFKFNEALYTNNLAYPLLDEQRIDFRNFYAENEIFIHIYLQNYKQAEEIALRILNSGYSISSINNYRCNYLLAVTYFLSKRYKESFRLLQDTKEIENDKEGWNLGVRMLQIYLTLDTDKVDLADQRIASLRKHIDRTSKLKTVRKRDIVILRIVNHLSRSGFDFKEVWEDRKKDFALLRSSDRDYLWEPRTHEMIVFDQWFESKVKGIDYQPKFPDPVE